MQIDMIMRMYKYTKQKDTDTNIHTWAQQINSCIDRTYQDIQNNLFITLYPKMQIKSKIL